MRRAAENAKIEGSGRVFCPSEEKFYLTQKDAPLRQKERERNN